MKKLIIGGLAALAAVISVGMPVASAEPAPVCTTVWRTMYTVPIGTDTTCFNPDGSYQVCNKLGRMATDRGRVSAIRHLQLAGCNLLRSPHPCQG